MHKIHCDYIKNKYVSNSRQLFSDTDSLMYETKTEDVSEDFSKDKNEFDFSNYSTKSISYDDSKKLGAGKMKDETGGVLIKEFVGFKPKAYPFLVDDSSEHKRPRV